MGIRSNRQPNWHAIMESRRRRSAPVFERRIVAAGCRGVSMALAADVEYSSSGFACRIPAAERISPPIAGAPKLGVKRPPSGSAHGNLNAPNSVFRTSNGYLMLAMKPLGNIAAALGDPDVGKHGEPVPSGSDRRERIHNRIEDNLRK